MRKLVLGVAMLMSTWLVIPAMSAEAAPLTCAVINKTYPLGVAKTAAAAKAAVKKGYARPVVNSRAYVSALRLDPKRLGYVCAISMDVVKNANAHVVFDAVASSNPAAMLEARSATSAGSPATDYLSRFAQIQQADDFADYLSVGLVPPPRAPSVVEITGSGVAPFTTVTITHAGGNQDVYQVEYDRDGRVRTWSTSVGPLADRIWKLTTSATAGGVTITAGIFYKTNLGSASLTATAVNNASSPRGLNFTATYVGTDGSRHEMDVTSGCLAPGQSMPIYAQAKSGGGVGLPSTVEFGVIADMGLCDTYQQLVPLSLPLRQ